MKHVYRLFPCPAYDIPGTERWLESMAAQGLLFEGVTLGMAVFRRDVPQAVRYRLDVGCRGFYASYDADRQHEAYAQSGWEFVARRGDFDVYRADDPEAVELHTDPKVRALSLDAANKRVRGRMFSLFYWVVCWSFIQHLQPVRLAVLLGAVWTVAAVILLIAWPVGLVREAIALRRIQTWLMKDRPLRDFPGKSRRWYRPCTVITAVLTGVFFVSGGIGLYAGLTRPDLPLSGLSQPLPFATLETLGVPGKFDPVPGPNRGGSFNTYTRTSNGLAPCVIELFQAGHFEAGGAETYASLDADYFDTRSPLLVRALAWEAEWNSRTRLFEHGYEGLEAPALRGVDYVSMYLDHYRYLTLTMVKDDRVLILRVNGDIDFSEHWQTFADSL